MKPIFRYWVFIEIWKLLIVLICVFTTEQITLILFMMGVLVLVTVANVFKMSPIIKRIINFSLIENNIENKELLNKTKNTLLLLVILDFLPFILLFTQAFLRYRYYRLEAITDQIIQESSLKNIHLYNV